LTAEMLVNMVTKLHVSHNQDLVMTCPT
jgi:hypothetical protein